MNETCGWYLTREVSYVSGGSAKINSGEMLHGVVRCTIRVILKQKIKKARRTLPIDGKGESAGKPSLAERIDSGDRLAERGDKIRSRR
jgi:hypothetical protein